jgi:hypothetical protein
MIITEPKTEKNLQEAMKREESSAKKPRRPLNFTPHGPSTPEELQLYNEAVFTWIAPEYIQHPKGRIWYFVASIVTAIFFIGATITANYTMALAILVFTGVYYYLHKHHPPKNIHITISKMGIKVGNMIFPYSHIKAFWIFYNPPFIKTINLRVKDHFFSDVIIELNNEDPVLIRQFLCGQIPEWEGKNERFSDVLLRILKL